jgi:hypothetical protein
LGWPLERVRSGRDFSRRCSRRRPWQPRLDPKRSDEDDPANTKLARRLNARSITEDDLLFLKQIGLRWARLEFGTEETPFEYLRATQQRFARYGIRIFAGVHYAYRSFKVQLGQPGRDQDIETYRTFLRDLGRLEIPVAS